VTRECNIPWFVMLYECSDYIFAECVEKESDQTDIETRLNVLEADVTRLSLLFTNVTFVLGLPGT
jgi:hypothetical protein